jgi:hypothetical protein
MAPSTITTVMLTGPEDWEPWITNLQAQIHPDLWRLIDPDEPERPFLESPYLIQVTDLNPNVTHFHELTATQQKTFENSRKFYEFDLKSYNTQVTQLVTARSVIAASVAKVKHIHLDRKESTREWLSQLKMNTEPSRGQLKHKAIDEYYSVLRMKPSGSKVESWIKQWEFVIAKGRRYDIPQLHDGQWLRDLATAIRPLSDVLYCQYIAQAEKPEESRVMKYTEIGKMLRQVLGHSKSTSRTTRGGAFAVDFTGSESDPNPDAPSKKGADLPTHGRKKRAGTTSVGRDMSTTKKSKRSLCPACGKKGHTFSECWCIFEDQRPEGYNPVEASITKAKKTVEKSKELTEQLQQLKQEAEKDSA